VRKVLSVREECKKGLQWKSQWNKGKTGGGHKKTKKERGKQGTVLNKGQPQKERRGGGHGGHGTCLGKIQKIRASRKEWYAQDAKTSQGGGAEKKRGEGKGARKQKPRNKRGGGRRGRRRHGYRARIKKVRSKH